MSQTFTQSDVASHNKADSLWIVVDGDVYDLTKFQDDHPGTYICRRIRSQHVTATTIAMVC